jgi:hypothetical protein
MRLLTPAVLLAFLVSVKLAPDSASSSRSNLSGEQQFESSQSDAGLAASLPAAGSRQDSTATPGTETITLPVGTKVTLALTSPIWAKTAKPGDAVYAETAFPVVNLNSMAIPIGTYVLGEIDAVTKPSRRDARALFQMHFSKIIFSNGYTLELESAPVQAATATVHVEVTARNDVLLDNGAQFDMIVQTPLALEAQQIAEAVRRTRPLPVGPAKSASACRLIPATPGTSDTVIPGTPGSPGTPDIVIPGAGGMPPTVIPGIPATPGTPATIFPGSPGTPAIPCPAPGAVIPGPSGPQIHTQIFQMASELTVSGTKLSSGSYQVTWLGTDVAVQVELLRDGKAIVRTAAHVVALPENSAADRVVTRTNPDGSTSIASLEFAGEGFELIFE